jgi:squalene-hopene/tetraprenyl-beta-curcumene cyclase
MDVTRERLDAAYRTAQQSLFAWRLPHGHWEGELSSSALSTATAVMALALVERHGRTRRDFSKLIGSGLRWLAEHQNEDGGWGDTVVSVSNISTTMLCRAALYLCGAAESHRAVRERAERWLFERYGSTPGELAEAVRRRYGKDRTFAVPILTTCALAGLVEWREVAPLPFELACFPQSWFRFLRLHVVSYALPALIAIGQAVHLHRGTWNPATWVCRHFARGPSLRVLESIQPTGGGFLEATPLTSFVTLSLASIGLAEHVVARNGIAFLERSVRLDGSWAIDTNLATWVTTLSINALAAAGDLDALDRKEELRDWLVGQQYRVRHPYTGAEPGAWAWTDLPGGVPDADDTPGAILALRHLRAFVPVEEEVFANGTKWLRNLQNSDGGWPTFCRGWGHLPFDRSGSDLTAHALRALQGDAAHAEARARGLAYLMRTQRADGSWLPLWFGNQHAPDDENPLYGTTRVLAAYRDLGLLADPAAQRGLAWLRAAQNRDGGWGGAAGAPSSVEETALAVEILADAPGADATSRGTAWLVEQIESGALERPTPIGFYFAKLWYYERLYPVIFAVAALGRARRCQGRG